MAERVGFEPTIRQNRIPNFESGAFDHSATFPLSACCRAGILALVTLPPKNFLLKLDKAWKVEET